MNSCPCGSGSTFAACCKPVITGKKPAPTAEKLMRARYSAYVNAEMDFIFETTHPDHREGYDHEGARAWAENSEWLGLQIISTTEGTKSDRAGEVEFIARFKEKGVPREHHEHARFIKEDSGWYFSEGVMAKPKPIISNKIGRNDPCTCGSGMKYKKCCGK